MPTNQEGRHAAACAISGTARDYNSDMLALFAAHGITAGNTFNEKFLLWLSYQLNATQTNLPAAMQAYAVACGKTDWDSLNTITNLRA